MPMDPHVKLTKTPEGEHHDIPEYAAAIGSLMYAAIGTWPDIAYAVQHPSQFTRMLIGEMMILITNLFQDTFSYLGTCPYHGHHANSALLLYPQWKQNIWLQV